MGLLDRLRGLGGRPDETAVTTAVGAAVLALPGVTEHSLVYTRQPNASASVTGVVDVADSPTFVEVLRVVRRELGDLVGDRADLVTFYLTGRTPDGAPVVPGDLGLVQPPTGRDVAKALLS